jgi:hypothetical protein
MMRFQALSGLDHFTVGLFSQTQTYCFFDSDLILPYVDASEPPCTTFTINLFDCWSALQKAKQRKLIDMSQFNCKEYVS